MLKVQVDEDELAVRPRALFFDLDHTLYDYEAPHEAALAEVRAKLQRALGVEPDRFDRFFAEAKQDVKRKLGRSASSHSRLLYFQRLLEMLGMKSDVLSALDYEQTYWRTFLTEASLFENARETLLLVRSFGIPLVLVTDLTAQIQFRKIVYFGLDSVFDYVVTSEETGADKPDPRIFEVAREKAGLAPEDRIWMVGDDAEKDGAGAKGCLDALFFHRHRGRLGAASGPADVTFDRYAELAPLFSRHLGE